MSKYAIVTDLDRCVGCLACSVACKTVNTVPIGQFWNKTLRIGPTPKTEGAHWPDVELYYLTVQCQHCEKPQCVEVCPTGASSKMADGTVQIDKKRCIGCQFCVMSCPYNVRYLNEEEKVVEKCTLCEQLIATGGTPQCVSQCGGRARYFGDLDDPTSEAAKVLAETDPSKVYSLPDVGNKPTFKYILREMKWRG
ncbi:MAG: 4Fe-4S dicluster domain-containing protein [Coriobacteriaceae bacterium]|jgi:Fe-S-cluster-containing dehydrogenase component|nr:4Fe-4S dicluster domain-containing protein [Coriobacteriaceae bacterium]